MKIEQELISKHNSTLEKTHKKQFQYTAELLQDKGVDVATVVDKLMQFQIAIPSWALGTGGTRFGRFPGRGEPGNLEEKMRDVGLLHKLNASSGAISLHIPWDIPENPSAIRALATELNIRFDAVNSNTFQDQPDQAHSYKFGSLCHTEKAVRQQAVEHNIEVIEYGEKLGSKAITVWLADGSSFPGQHNFRHAFEHTVDSLQKIYATLPEDWKLLLEYKPFEPNFYSTVIPDWGTSFLMVNKLGPKAHTLVDLGHHLPNTNIEQIVATLMMEGRLGGFHFNDSKFADDDLTVGTIKPYQLFLIFNELVEGMETPGSPNPIPDWMIDASHNLKDPLADLLQSVEAIKIAYAQALIIDRAALAKARIQNDVTLAQEILQDAYRTDVRPLLAEARLQAEAALDPVSLFSNADFRGKLVEKRGASTVATGL